MALREPYTEAARYALLSELALSLSEASDMEALTREFVPKLKYMIDFNRCTLALLEEDGTAYRLLILLETRQETSQASSDNISLQCGISGKVILSEEICVLDSRGRNWVKQWPIADEAMEGGSLNSIMCLPLQVSGKPFGAITFGTGQIGYSRADISTASIIANHLSLAIDRWNMIQKLRSANEEIQKLNAELETRVQERTDELVKTNKQLSEEKERYRNLYLKTPAVLHSIDAEGELVSVSDFWLEKFGYTRSEEVIGRKSLEFLTEESKKFAMTEAIPQMKKHGYVREFPFQFVKKNGEIMDILLSATVELDENGNYLRSLAVLEDVTERKRAEEALRTSEERYRSLYTKTPVMLHSIDAAGKMISVSDYWRQNLGYKLNEVIGRRIPEFLTQASRQDAENIFLPEFFKTGFLKEAELQFVKKNGEVIDVLLSAIAERDAKGEIVRSMAVLVDVTERKQAEESLHKALSEVKQLKNQLQAENIYLQEEIEKQYNFEEIIGASAAMQKVFQNIEKVAVTDATVLLTGETGTGKELVARAIHNSSNRKDRVMVTVNCGALPTGLVESELFGHEKGAFTGATSQKKGRFELADRGTIFLDEVGELALETQVKLLRVLQEQEFERVGGTQTLKVNVRVIAATNRNLEEAVKQGAFRADLFYRINIFPIHIPPLRERIDDIPLLTDYFIRKFSRRMGRRVDSVSSKSMKLFMNYDWSGNVRELANILERAIILCEGRVLQQEHIGISIQRPIVNGEITSLEAAERAHILKALEKTSGVVGGPKGAAKLLGVNRSTLWSRMKKLDIDVAN